MSASHLLLTDTNAKPFLNVPTRRYHRHQQKLSCTRQAILRDGSEKRDRADSEKSQSQTFYPHPSNHMARKDERRDLDLSTPAPEFKSASDLFGCCRLCLGRVLALFDLQ